MKRVIKSTTRGRRSWFLRHINFPGSGSSRRGDQNRVRTWIRVFCCKSLVSLRGRNRRGEEEKKALAHSQIQRSYGLEISRKPFGPKPEIPELISSFLKRSIGPFDGLEGEWAEFKFTAD